MSVPLLEVAHRHVGGGPDAGYGAGRVQRDRLAEGRAEAVRARPPRAADPAGVGRVEVQDDEAATPRPRREDETLGRAKVDLPRGEARRAALRDDRHVRGDAERDGASDRDGALDGRVYPADVRR